MLIFGIFNTSRKINSRSVIYLFKYFASFNANDLLGCVDKDEVTSKHYLREQNTYLSYTVLARYKNIQIIQ